MHQTYPAMCRMMNKSFERIHKYSLSCICLQENICFELIVCESTHATMYCEFSVVVMAIQENAGHRRASMRTSAMQRAAGEVGMSKTINIKLRLPNILCERDHGSLHIL